MRILTLFYLFFLLFCMVFTGNTHAQSLDWADKIPDAWIKYKALQPITDQVALYQKGELWGVVQSDGRELTPAVYSNLFVSDGFPDAIAIGNRDDNYKIKGLLSLTGQVIVAPVHASLHRLANGTIRACGDDYTCQDFSPTGDMLSNPLLKQYKSNGKEQDGFICASEDGVHFGLLDAKGAWSIAPEHPPLWPHPNGWWTYPYAWDQGRLLYPNLTTKEALFLGEAFPLSGGIYWKMAEGIWKQYDKSGRYVAPITGFEPIRYAYVEPYITIQNMGKKGLCDLNGKVVLEPAYRSVIYQTRSNVYIVTDDLGRQGLWDDGSFKLPVDYDEITYCAPQFFAIKGGQTSIFSLEFELIATIAQRIYAGRDKSIQRDESVIPTGNMIKSRKSLPENRKLWHSKNGLIPIPDKAVSTISYGTQHYIMENGTQALCDDKGAIILENCDEITTYRTFRGPSQVLLFRKNNLWGCTDRHGKVLLEPQFEQLIPLQYGYFLAQKDLLWGILDPKGIWTVKPTYESYLLKPLLGLYKNKKWRIFDVESGQLSNLDLEHYEEKNGVLQATIDGIPVALSKNGQRHPENDLRPIERLFNREQQIIKEENGRKALCTAQGKVLSPFVYKEINCFSGILPVMHIWADLIEGGNVLLDTSGKELIRMDSIIPCPQELYFVKSNGKWEALDRNLQPIGTFNAISRIIYHLSSARFLVEIAENSWVVKDLNNRTLHTFSGKIRNWNGNAPLEIEQDGKIRYQSLSNFDEAASTYKLHWKTAGFSILKKDSLIYIQKPNGQPVVEGSFETWGSHGYGTLYSFQRKDSIVVVDQMGEIRLPLCAKKVYSLNDFQNYLPYILQRSSSSGKEIWNTKNDRVLPSKSNQVIRCKSTFFLLNQGNDNLYNLYDSHLLPLLPEFVDQIRVLSTSLVAVQRERYGNYHIYNMEERKYTGQVVTAVSIRENDFWRASENGEFLIYHDTQLLFRRKCKSLDWSSSDNQLFLIVRDEKGWQLIDYRGNTLCPEYFSSMVANYNGFLYVTKNGKNGVLNPDGTFLLFTEYDQIVYHSNFHLFLVQKNGLWGLIQRSRKVILPVEFQELKYLEYNGPCIIGMKNGRYGFYSVAGKKYFGRDWEYADQFSEGLAAVRDKGKWGYINTAGATVIPFSFEYAHRFHSADRGATVIKDGQFWDINVRGEKIGTSNGIPDFGQYFSPLELLPNKADFENYMNIGDGWQLFRQKSTRKFGLMDYSGKIRLQPEYDQLDFEVDEKGVWIKGKKDEKVVKFGLGLERVE